MTSNSQLLLFIVAGLLILTYISNANGKSSFLSNVGSLQGAELPADPKEKMAAENPEPAKPAPKKTGCDASSFDGRWNASNLLPSETSVKSDWAIQTPSELTDKNFLTSKQLDGVDTTGSSMKNASRDLRAEPVIPKMEVGPWQQSTIVRNDNYQVRKLDII